MNTQSVTNRSKRIVLLQGAFDILNWGHVKAFERAKTLGGTLIIALNTDELLEKYKGRKAVIPWQQKKEILESIRFVDKVVPAPEFSPLALLKQYNVDVYLLTKEWENTKAEEIRYMHAKGGEVNFSPRFEGVVCTSEIKRRLLAEAKEKELNTPPCWRDGRWVVKEDDIKQSPVLDKAGNIPAGMRKPVWD